MDTITFNYPIIPSTEHPLIFCPIELVINAQKVKTGKDIIINFHALMAHYDESANLDPFTCCCGVAGCAGIHTKTKIVVTDTTVEWHLPFAELSQAMDTSALKEILIFDKQEYLATLSKLYLQLTLLEKETNKIVYLGTPAHFESTNGGDDFDYAYPTTTLEEVIKQYRHWLKKNKENDEKRLAIYTDWAGKSICKCSAGTCYELPLEWAIDLYAEHSGYTKNIATLQNIVSRIRTNALSLPKLMTAIPASDLEYLIGESPTVEPDHNWKLSD